MEQLKRKYLLLTSLLTSSSNLKLVIFLLLGLILIGSGVLLSKIGGFSSSDKVEVLNAATAGPESSQDIVAEISGAVEKPGVYTFKSGARVNDLIISAGGISANASRDWIDKNINKASKLFDGQKLYIYHLDEVSAKGGGDIKLDQQVLGTNNQSLSDLINVNTATQSELEKLKGIGPVYAQKIAEYRPYSNTEELLTKKVLTKNVYEKIKNAITVN